ncbi:hypothetical protein SAMN05216389_13224 [Oceanobacillus limi]|uniref:Nuclease-related domain-containing protein n=1 Tax=Oceanobacillus limi TaxID=930131 RepID=A0A1I0HDD4_9BACI|nr:hypothetical protein [Oceanobacillus limi]SET81848.1 hypothetical protein SAMN05216389_13224 [Oceanobacillus limi]
MGIFIGRNRLVGSVQGSFLVVGDVLCDCLPDDTYIIGKPNLGETIPDYIILSPAFGFRIIEVKDIHINNIEYIHPNGMIKVKEELINPFGKVKSHAVAWKNYLLTHHRDIGLGDPIRYIGYAVVHKGFTKLEFEYEFGKKLSNWIPGDLDSYYKYHYCIDEIDKGFDKILARSTRFKSYPLKEFQIKAILDHLMSDNVTSNRVVEAKADDAEEDNQVTETNNTQGKSNRSMLSWLKNDMDKKGLIVFLLAAILISIVFAITKFSGNMHFGQTSKAETVSSLEVSEKHSDERVILPATIEQIEFDSVSGNTYLVLTDGDGYLEAVIRNETSIDLEKGESYTFEGFVQTSTDNESGWELNIVRVD